MLTAFEICEEAVYRAKVPGYLPTFGIRNLNAILSDICQHHDFALARGVHRFSFNPALASMFGSGPYVLPLDYLRTSGSSGATGASGSVWYLYPTPAFPSGQPLYMTPIDLAEFDGYPQFPSQSTPELWATDMGGPADAADHPLDHRRHQRPRRHRQQPADPGRPDGRSLGGGRGDRAGLHHPGDRHHDQPDRAVLCQPRAALTGHPSFSASRPLPTSTRRRKAPTR